MARAKLSMVFQDVRGRVGEQVVAKSRSGLSVRGRPKYRYPMTPGVEEGVLRMRIASAIWDGMTRPQADAWHAYAESIHKRSTVTGVTYSPTGRNTFTGLATKILQIDPEAVVPTSPPTSAFVGDSVTLTVESELDGARVTASGPNSADCLIEILMQRLPNVRSRPKAFYKSLMFHRFAPGGLTLDISLPPGAYAFAYRMVNPSTGQATLQQTLGVVIVEP